MSKNKFQNKDKTIILRVSDDEKKRIEKAANQDGETVSGFIRRVVLAAIRRKK